MKHLSLLPLILLICLVGCGDPPSNKSPVLVGSGNPVDDVREIDNFEEFATNGDDALDIRIKVGPKPKAIVHGDDNIVEYILVDVNKNSLYVRLDYNGVVQPKSKLWIEVTVPKLAKAGMTGNNKLQVSGIKAGDFIVTVNGKGQAKFSGTADFLEVRSSGDTRVEAIDLVAKEVDFVLTGGAYLSFFATEKIIGGATTKCNVEYGGPGKLELTRQTNIKKIK